MRAVSTTNQQISVKKLVCMRLLLLQIVHFLFSMPVVYRPHQLFQYAAVTAHAQAQRWKGSSSLQYYATVGYRARGVCALLSSSSVCNIFVTPCIKNYDRNRCTCSYCSHQKGLQILYCLALVVASQVCILHTIGAPYRTLARNGRGHRISGRGLEFLRVLCALVSDRSWFRP